LITGTMCIKYTYIKKNYYCFGLRKPGRYKNLVAAYSKVAFETLFTGEEMDSSAPVDSQTVKET